MEYRQHLLLIFKEAINNSLKYSDGTEILLGVALKGSKLNIKLTDDGNGFDTQQVSTGNGLRNMKDRADRIGGTLTIQSIAGKGTAIEFDGQIV
jgi:signal transduction histidine kinase